MLVVMSTFSHPPSLTTHHHHHTLRYDNANVKNTAIEVNTDAAVPLKKTAI
jgi:hypothetical protein